jgi:hypothetical protein
MLVVEQLIKLNISCAFYLRKMIEKTLKNTTLHFMLTSYLLSCSNSDHRAKANKDFETSEKSSLEIKRPPLNFIPRGAEPLRFPAGTFDWQPKNTNIVVHTGLESYIIYPDRIRTINKAMHTAELEISLELHHDHPILPARPTTRTWIAINIDAMRFENNLHFFEVKPDLNRDPVGNSLFFAWQPAPNLTIYNDLASNRIKIYISSNGEPANNFNDPKISEKWLNFAQSCFNYCSFDIFVWSPEINTFKIIKAKAKYTGTDAPDWHLPMVIIRDSERP